MSPAKPDPSRAAPTGVTTLLVIAKEPLPGRVKTRLTPPFAPAEAARLAEAALGDTLRTVAALPAARRAVVLEGAPGPWLPPGIEVVAQGPGGLDERLAAAFGACTGPTLLIGMDTPQITAADLAPALSPGAGSAVTPGSVPPRTAASGHSAWPCRTPGCCAVCRCPCPRPVPCSVAGWSTPD